MVYNIVRSHPTQPTEYTGNLNRTPCQPQVTDRSSPRSMGAHKHSNEVSGLSFFKAPKRA